ncbi:hypothetical protein DW1_2413 [Proteiniborus sp. DW1]|nr:hypothetical protein DW1_2413 [Proteiniborus sp. DW1]
MQKEPSPLHHCIPVKDRTIYYSLNDFGEDLVHIIGHLEDLEEKYFQVFKTY